MHNFNQIWLIPLILLGLLSFFLRMKMPIAWSWCFLVQALAMVLSGWLGFLIGPSWLWAIFGWTIFFVFMVVPKLMLNQMQQCLVLVHTERAMVIGNQLRWFYWGNTGQFFADSARISFLYMSGKAQQADQIIAHWENKKMPPLMSNYLDATKLTTNLLLQRWQAIVDDFEKVKSNQLGISPALASNAARAYAELGDIEAAAHSLEIANLAGTRLGSASLALTFLPFFSLAGAKEKVECLLAQLSLGMNALPEFARTYWLGRCFAAAGEKENARELFDKSLTLLAATPAQKVNIAVWKERIQQRIDLLQEEGKISDWSNEINRVWLLFQRAAFVQEIIMPGRNSRLVLALVALICGAYLITAPYHVVFNPLTKLLVPSNLFHSSFAQTCAGIELSRFNLLDLDAAKVLEGQWWRLITYLFLHGSISHCLLNVLGLYWFGRIAETIYGSLNLLLVFLLAGAASGLTHILLSPEAAIGASGAVMGIFGLVAVGIVKLKDVLPANIRKVEIAWMAGLAIGQVILDKIIPHVAAFAHLGGLITGVILGLILPVVTLTGQSACRTKKIGV